MSEWGNPARVIAALLPPEYIGLEERTRGSETSQYPEEKKTMSDSRSSGERNGKRPNRRTKVSSGLRGRGRTMDLLAEPSGKARPKRVIVPYAKTEL